jgi:nucleoside-diphosphate-sugar epimerase
VTEDSPFDPLPAFAWGAAHVRRVLCAPGLHPIVIHPAMVFEGGAGVFQSFHDDARERRAVRVVGAESVGWPLVHAADLAVLYRLALEHAPAGQSYLGAAIESLAVGRIARAFARRYGTEHLAPEVVSVDDAAAALGEWARGYARSQRQSGAKARRDLGWTPRHTEPEAEIAALGT